ncbi:hypothetical protein [Bradyrhizobium sp. 33ap4]|uniref:hypothetical protein n=1 Tax=Bradyrhizobium sp. 33ap4 TaxID=3061630 RepID=UPI0029310923|nr:hypothetical protein [Bradyrhizobium sp. 33ap4]
MRSFNEQTIFWAPDVLPTVVPGAVIVPPLSASAAPRPLLDLAADQIRRAADGWHVVLRIETAKHRVWSKEPRVVGLCYSAELPFDGDFEERVCCATGCGVR